MAVGGGAYKIAYRVDRADHSRIIPKGTASTAVAEAAATAITAPAPSDAALVLKTEKEFNRFVESTGLKWGDDGVGTVTYSHTFLKQAWLDFVAIAAPKSAVAGGNDVEEAFAEDGTKFGGASAASGAVYLFIDLGPLDEDGLFTSMFIGSVKKTTNSMDFKSKTFVRPTFEVSTVECNKTGGAIIPPEAFDDTIWGTIVAGDRTIAKGDYVKQAFLAAAT